MGNRDAVRAGVRRLSADYAWKRTFYDALGRETFRSETERQGVQGERVPTLAAHRRN